MQVPPGSRGFRDGPVHSHKSRIHSRALMSLPCPHLVQELGHGEGLLEGSRPLGLTSAHRHKPFLPRGSQMDQELAWELQGASPPLPSWDFVSPALPGPSQRSWCSGLCLSCPHPLPRHLAPWPPVPQHVLRVVLFQWFVC